MKIVAYITRAFPIHSQTFIVNQIISTKKAGYRVNVLTYNLNKFKESSQSLSLTQHNIASLISVIDFKCPKNNVLRYIKGLFLFLKYLKYSTRIKYISLSDFLFFKPYMINYFITYKDVDVFHVHFADAGLDIGAMKSAGLIKGDLILSLHGFSIHHRDEIERQKIYKTYQELFNQSKIITVNSQYLLNKMLSLGCKKEKMFILPMGVDTDFYKTKMLKKINGKLKLISVGRLIELKGHEFGIKSVKNIVDKGIDVEYTIVGEGKLKQELIDLVQQLGLTNHVKFKGKKSQLELKKLYSENHIFLMTSVTDRQNRAEAQGVVSLEAQAMGLPVIAFDSGGVNSTISSNTGILVEERNVYEYTEAILKVYNNKNLYHKMSKAAIEFINSHFALKKLNKQLVALYH